MSSTSQAARLEVFNSDRRPHPVIEEALELYRYRDLLNQWTARSIKLRYKRSVLGILWTLVEPLMMMSILTVVFSAAFRFPLLNYPVYLLSGLLFFDFFRRSTMQMLEEIVASHHLARRVHVPRSTFAVAALLSHLVNWLIALLPLFGIVLFFGHPLTPALLVLPAGILCGVAFAFGIGLLVSTVGAFFHDLKLIYGVLLTAFFYGTPILYPIEIVPEHFRVYFELNPLHHLCRLVRDPIYLGEVSPAGTWLFGGGASLVAAVAGWWVFCRWRSAIEYHG